MRAAIQLAEESAAAKDRIATLETLLREAREYVVWWECIPEAQDKLSPFVARIDAALGEKP